MVFRRYFRTFVEIDTLYENITLMILIKWRFYSETLYERGNKICYRTSLKKKLHYTNLKP